ncbi:MAG: hypothetical protein NC081_11775 [Roseburia sp.]|nr:hypothetical protein [Roseburia sp.]
MDRKKAALAVFLSMLLCWGAGCTNQALLEEIPREAALRIEDGKENPKETFSFVQEEFSEYAYRSLTKEEQIWYRDMKEIVGCMQEKGELSKEGIDAGLDETDIDLVFQCLLIDHPEFFYVDGYSYTKYSRGGKLLTLEFAGNYTMEIQEARYRGQQIEEAAQDMLSKLSAGASEYDKVKYVYETIIRNTDYDLQAPDNQNIYSVFINHSSVCQGYAKACQYLLGKLGMECVLVQGTVDTGEGHAWNLIKVDGSYYYLDSTWGDASYQLGEAPDSVVSRKPEINYDYLCVTTAELLRTHTLGGYLTLPECTDNRANYYVRENAYFTAYDREKMERLFQKAADRGQADVTVKCSDLNCYREVEQAMIQEQEIFRYLTTDECTVSYAENEKQLSLTFWVTNE